MEKFGEIVASNLRNKISVSSEVDYRNSHEYPFKANKTFNGNYGVSLQYLCYFNY